ncbi:hypothetical protein TRVL_05808 [Trypanosoma vivax]|nr:hypothetical protein TRVL_05808 [Trypanosoma vivax]
MEQSNEGSEQGPGTMSFSLPQLSCAPPQGSSLMKLLRRSVESFVRQRLEHMDVPSLVDESAVQRTVESLLVDETDDGARALDSLRDEWRQILANTLSSEASAGMEVTPPIVATPLLLDSHEHTSQVLETLNSDLSPSSVNVLRFDCESDFSFDIHSHETGPDALTEAHDTIDACLQEWVKGKRPLNQKKRASFLRALRTLLETDVDVPIFDGNWDFWQSTLFLCMEHTETAWSCIDLIYSLLYDRLTARQKFVLIEAVSRELGQPRGGTTKAESEATEENLLHLLHKLLLKVESDTDISLEEGVSELLPSVVGVVVDHVTFFDRIDPRAQWFKAILVHPAMVPSIVALPRTFPDIFRKMQAALPATHVMSLLLSMMPLCAKEHGDAADFLNIFSQLLCLIISGKVLDDMAEDALRCVERCICRMQSLVRLEHFRYVLGAFDGDSEGVMCDISSVSIVLKLLLVLVCPYSYEVNKGFRLPPKEVKMLEKALVKRTEIWYTKFTGAQALIDAFWWKLLHWYATDLPKVVRRVVRSVTQGSKRAYALWGEGHLVAISTVLPMWPSVAEVLDADSVAETLNYTAVLNSMRCCDTVSALQEQCAPIDQKPALWRLLMKWCTNIHARRGLFLATGEAMRQLEGGEEAEDTTLLVLSMEELETMTLMPHTVPEQRAEQVNMLASLQTIRLWIASLSPSRETVATSALNTSDMLAKQLNSHWLWTTEKENQPRPPFGDDSLALLLSVGVAEVLTSAPCARVVDPIQEVVRNLLVERSGTDPVWQLGHFLTCRVGDGPALADALAHRFDALSEPSPRANGECHITPGPDSNSVQIDQEHIDFLAGVIRESDPSNETDWDSKKLPLLEPVLQLLLWLHDRDTEAAASLLKAYPFALWNAYSRCEELALGVAQRVAHAHPHVERLLHIEGVDLYYTALLCVRRWLRDPSGSRDSARTSLLLFLRHGNEAWECSVANALYEHIQLLHAAHGQYGEFSAWSESNLYPINPFWALCLTNTFALPTNINVNA